VNVTTNEDSSFVASLLRRFVESNSKICIGARSVNDDSLASDTEATSIWQHCLRCVHARSRKAFEELLSPRERQAIWLANV